MTVVAEGREVELSVLVMAQAEAEGRLIMRKLRSIGHKAIRTRSAVAAVEQALTVRPDLVLVGMSLEVDEPVLCLGLIRRAWPEMPVIAVSPGSPPAGFAAALPLPAPARDWQQLIDWFRGRIPPAGTPFDSTRLDDVAADLGTDKVRRFIAQALRSIKRNRRLARHPPAHAHSAQSLKDLAAFCGLEVLHRVAAEAERESAGGFPTTAESRLILDLTVDDATRRLGRWLAARMAAER